MAVVKMTHPDHGDLAVPDVGNAIARYERAGWTRKAEPTAAWQPLPAPATAEASATSPPPRKKTTARRAAPQTPSQED